MVSIKCCQFNQHIKKQTLVIIVIILMAELLYWIRLARIGTANKVSIDGIIQPNDQIFGEIVTTLSARK